MSLPVKRIGSKLSIEVVGALTSFQVALAGETESSKVTRSVWRMAMNMTLPVAQLTPSVGSPASSPMPLGDWWTVKLGACPLAVSESAGAEDSTDAEPLYWSAAVAAK